MTVLSTSKDTDALTMTIDADFSASPERVWQVWSDPRQLERWWGPPTWPATFVEHDFVVGGGASYFMTGPEGEKAPGLWRFVAIDEPRSLEFENFFADDAGEVDPSMPAIMLRADLRETPEGARMTITTRFPGVAEMQQMVDMGMAEGLGAAMGQIDAILADA
ncbi:SRPBCC family protein [Cellulomonas chengniuliangii]|uniref:SRPBCC domain-containing protein n=1 Tax=Cellulomonas chengniuliangii TaxID=2968084 RepID=A0ABY5KYL4_9CELL|nr:SRPBCC domain-containing protein [Cellulomonas chengniuliangii]MCC2307631.1 SRPBCC domain-containing protein [Cellulomonas chengniuliangii]UUI75602.1 SRPBCC domain-containing protein [Cellulomonas chengniuliangii]